MVKHNFFANSFFAISQDVENRKEYIIYCIGEADLFFNGYSTKKVVYKERSLGEIFIDFSTNMNEYQHSADRENLLIEYIEGLLFLIKHSSVIYSGSDDQEKIQEMKKIIRNIDKKIISDDFFSLQKHLPCFNTMNSKSNDIVNKLFSDISIDENKMRIKEIDGRNYYITDFYFNCLLALTLNQLYSTGLYPRTCFRCGKMLLAKNNHVKVLCSDECKKENNVEKTMRYHKNRNEAEKHFHRIYDKWNTRIRKCEKNGLLCNEDILKLKEGVAELTETNRKMANLRKKNYVNYKNGLPDYYQHDMLRKEILDRMDDELYRMYLIYKGK